MIVDSHMAELGFHNNKSGQFGPDILEQAHTRSLELTAQISSELHI